MNASFLRIKATDEWYTPLELIQALGEFDLYPCAPISPLWQTARVMYNKNDDGVTKEWHGRVWLNPPYTQPFLKQFVQRMANHNNGIALLYNLRGNTMFHDIIIPTATAMKFLRKCIRFYRPDGTQGGCSGCGSVLISWGEDNARVIQSCKLEGDVVSL